VPHPLAHCIIHGKRFSTHLPLPIGPLQRGVSCEPEFAGGHPIENAAQQQADRFAAAQISEQCQDLAPRL
jgi:hypothetical protein